jgi:hypothetical protein
LDKKPVHGVLKRQMSEPKADQPTNEKEVILDPDQIEKVRRARLLVRIIMWAFIILPFVLFLFLHGWSFH